jgi:hypothetical protein
MRKVSPRAVKKFEAKQIARFRKWQTRRPGLTARTFAWLTKPVAWAVREIVPHNAVDAALNGNIVVARRWARERATLKSLGASQFAEVADGELLQIDRAVRKVQSRATYMAAGIGLAAGALGIFGLPLGIAAALNVALRTIHRVGLCYGYTEQTDAERLFVYYTLSLAGNRTPDEKALSLAALRELQAAISAASDGAVDEERRHHAIEIAHHDFTREITKQLVDVRLLTAIPGIGALIGLIVDTRYMSSVGWAARHAYQARWLRQKGRWPD